MITLETEITGKVIWEDGTEETLEWIAPSIGTAYEFTTDSGYYMFYQGIKKTMERGAYDYEEEFYPWGESDKQVKEIQYTTIIR